MHEQRRATDPVNTGSSPAAGEPHTTFYVDALRVLDRAGIPFLVGGAFAHSRYTGRDRDTKDLDVLLKRDDVPRALTAFGRGGYDTELLYPHWLAKVRRSGHYIDIVFSSGNAIIQVDDRWFAHATRAEVLGMVMNICPPEELIWSSAVVQERERYDGAEVLHLLHARASQLDWARLLERFGQHWPVLFAHLVLFQFAYPDRRGDVPERVMTELTTRLREQRPEPDNRVCYGTLLSRQQYLFDVDQLGYADARVQPHGEMTRTETEIWTRAIDERR